MMRTEEASASVLLVDDTPANLLALEAVLSPLGIRLVQAQSGREAVTRAATEPFALVLLDVQMPEMDGFDVARALRSTEYGRETPIIFLTAIHHDEAFARRGYAVGAADYITKPFDPDVLRARVRAFVDLFNQREMLRRTQVALRTRERDEAMRQLVAFEQIAAAALECDGLDDFLRKLLGLFIQYADAADSAAVLLREDDVLRTAVSIGMNEEVEADDTIPIGQGFAGTIAVTRQPLLVHDAAASPLVESAWLRARGTRALFGVPLFVGNDVIGAAMIGSRTAEDFTANDKRLIGLMAERAAAAVVRHRVLRSHERRTELLARAGTTLAGSLDSAETIRGATALPLPVLGELCFVDLVDASGTLRRAEVATRNGVASALRSDLASGAIDPHGPLAAAIERGETVLLRDSAPMLAHALASTAAGRAALERVAPRSAIVAPLAARGQRLGAMVLVATRAPHSRDDAQLAEEIARRAALAIDNARLFELAQREREIADEANRLKDEFLATVSHELRTPLNAMLGWTSILRRGHDGAPSIGRGLEVIERSALTQKRLIEDLLDIGRIVSGKMRVALERVDLRRVIDAALETMRPAAETKGIAVHVTHDEPLAIAADFDRLQQVIVNLLGNAVKFTDRGGRVRVRVERDAANAVIAVEDTGCGIDPAFLPNVFEAFRQADGSSTRSHGGLGLGLSIARHIVELHGGTIRAASEGRGRGARFVLSLPLVALHAEAGTARRSDRPSPPEPRRALEGLRVLVVDDEPDSRELLAMVFEDFGALSHAVGTANDAIEVVRAHRPDVVFSDIGMPEEDGYALVRRLRALPPDEGGLTPIVALTAYARRDDRLRALDAGFDAHVPKPIDTGEVVRIAAKLGMRTA